MLVCSASLILLAVLASRGVWRGSDTTSQAVQVPTQGQVQPIPLAPTPLFSSQTSTACLVSCDNAVMNCQNARVVVGPTNGAREP